MNEDFVTVGDLFDDSSKFFQHLVIVNKTFAGAEEHLSAARKIYNDCISYITNNSPVSVDYINDNFFKPISDELIEATTAILF